MSHIPWVLGELEQGLGFRVYLGFRGGRGKGHKCRRHSGLYWYTARLRLVMFVLRLVRGQVHRSWYGFVVPGTFFWRSLWKQLFSNLLPKNDLFRVPGSEYIFVNVLLTKQVYSKAFTRNLSLGETLRFRPWWKHKHHGLEMGCVRQETMREGC